MEPADFVYSQIFKGALNNGASQNESQQQAVMGMEAYKKGKISKKVSHLIEEKIKTAVANTKRTPR